MPQLAAGFDAPTLNYGAARKAGRRSRTPEANWIAPSYRRLKSGVPKERKFEPTF
jgi:hypothetical protein